MEKSEFRVLIKHCFLMGKDTVKAKQWLECYSDTTPSKQQLRGGMLTLNAVVQTQMMLSTQVIQIWQLSWNTLKKTPNLFWPIVN